MIEPRLRPAVAADVPAIERLVRDAYSVYLPRMGRPPGPMLDDYAGLVAEGRVQVVGSTDALEGVLVLIPEADALLLDNVAVAPAAQGRGLGSRLIAAAEAATRAAGYRTLLLYTHETMTENIQRYARLGFEETRRGEARGLRRVYMAKRLD